MTFKEGILILEKTFNEIEIAIDAGLYTLALGMTLCIPDICAALESGNGKTEGNKYRKWYRENIGDEMFLSSSDCYAFRCAFLHQGTTEHKGMAFKKILFVVPDGRNNVFHNNVLEDVLNLDLKIFCTIIINAAKEWLIRMKDDSNYKRNVEKSFKLYPNGLFPYFVGGPVYA